MVSVAGSRKPTRTRCHQQRGPLVFGVGPIGDRKRRLRELAEHGLLEKAEDKRGYYRITDRGRAYLAGELDADELEKV